MRLIYNDGGRLAAGFKGEAGDCAVRAIAIAACMSYAEAYDAINAAAGREKPSKKRKGRRSEARNGVYAPTVRRYLESLGWTWTPTMFIGSGCTVHLKSDELPAGRLIVNVSKHYCAVIDGVLHDTHDCTRYGTRCVYGYFQML